MEQIGRRNRYLKPEAVSWIAEEAASRTDVAATGQDSYDKN
jgi:hypothetical protein